MPFLSFFSKRKTKSTDRLHCIRDNLYSFLLESTAEKTLIFSYGFFSWMVFRYSEEKMIPLIPAGNPLIQNHCQTDQQIPDWIHRPVQRFRQA